MEIKNWRELSTMGPVLALFDVYFPKTTEVKRNIKYMLSKKGGNYFSFPSVCEEDAGGNKKWLPAYNYSEERQKEFINALYEAVEPFVKSPVARTTQ